MELLDKIFDDFKLNPIPPEGLRGVWSFVEPGLYEVNKYDGTHWIVEDVYAAIVNGQASLYVADDGGDKAGFVVLQRLRSYDGWHLHMWCAYGVNGTDRLLEKSWPTIKSVARTAGCRRITFFSPRKGWERVGAAFGFKPTQVHYECEV